METFIELKEFVNNSNYSAQRQKVLNNIADESIDKPILHIIHAINTIPYCFTLQSCYGHFVHNGNKDAYNLEPLSITSANGEVEYRIAYIALCIDNSDLGKKLFRVLSEIPKIDPSHIQFCCAEWFWRNQVNSYVLQVEPDKYKYKDKIKLPFSEAQYIENVRDKFFSKVNNIFQII